MYSAWHIMDDQAMAAAIPPLKRKSLPLEKEAQKEGGPFWRRTHSA